MYAVIDAVLITGEHGHEHSVQENKKDRESDVEAFVVTILKDPRTDTMSTQFQRPKPAETISKRFGLHGLEGPRGDARAIYSTAAGFCKTQM